MHGNHANTIALIAVLVIIGAAVLYVATSAMTVNAPTTSLASSTTPAATSTVPAYYTDVSTWQTDEDNTAGLTIRYPIDFDANANTSPTPSTDWRLGANGAPGNLSFTLTIPKAFEPQTNFSDAKLTVGESGNATAVADCLTPAASGSPNASETTETINGIPFTVFTFSDAGAGNIYDTTSYRTLHAGKCYAVEYTIHSANIGNYPASYHLQPFDETKVKDVLDRIVGTFTFL